MISSEQQIFNCFDRAQNILITGASDRNGDALSVALALYLFFKKTNKTAAIAFDGLNNNARPNLAFLPGYTEIKDKLDNLAKFIVSINIANAQVDQIKYTVVGQKLNFIISPKSGFFTKEDVSSETSGYSYDLIVTLGTPDFESLGKIYDNNVDFFYKTNIVNIDHGSGNEEYGQVNFIELNAVATAEILFEILKDYKSELIDADIATCLLAGIIYKTRSFKTPNLTPHALSVTSELIKLGARREEIVNSLYRSRDLDSLKLWGKVLNNLVTVDDGQIAYSNIFKNDLSGGNIDEQLKEVVEELIINLPSAQLIIVFYSLSETRVIENLLTGEAEIAVQPADTEFMTRALVYSTKNINCLDLLKDLAPIGNRKVAYLNINKPMRIAQNEILEKIRERIAKISL